MRQTIQKLGRVKLVFIITLIAFLLAALIDSIIAHSLDHQFKQSEAIIRALIISIVVAPIISWYLVGVFFQLDILEQKMRKLATYDDLTGLLNRRVFYRSAEKLHNVSVRNKQNYCLLIVDLDGFKSINDKYGHAAGDKVLSIFGQVSQDTIRDSDIVARLGGEEFIYFLPNTNTKEAESLANRLCEKIRTKAVLYDNNYIQYTISIGIALNNCKNKQSMEETIKMADDALYLAKEDGGNMIKTSPAQKS